MTFEPFGLPARPGPLYFRKQSLASLERALDSLDVFPVKSLPPALTIESQRTHHNTKTVIVVAGVRLIIVTVGGATIVRLIAPRAATQPEWRIPIPPPARERRNL
jgi:hypothetical protein